MSVQARGVLAALCALCLAQALACGKGGPKLTSFKADKDGINALDPVTLSWQVSNADRVSIDNGVGLVTGNSTVVNPQDTTTYTLSASSISGTATARVTVTVSTHIAKVLIKSFTASARQVQPGAAVTLSWVLTGSVATLAVGGAPALAATATSLVVNPTSTTRYTLTATGQVGPQPRAPSLLVRVAPAPAIATFTPSATQVQQGASVTLSWSATSAFSYLLSSDQGLSASLGLVTSKIVRPIQKTTYTLTATGPTGSSSQKVTVTVTAAAAHSLSFVPSAPGGAAVQLIADACNDPCATITLHLVAAQDFSASALALDLPLDGLKVALHSLSDTKTPGFSVNALAIDPGISPPAQAALLPTTGPLASVLTLGLARKPSGNGAKPGDATIHAGDKLCTFRLDLNSAGGQGVVFPLPGAQARALVRGSAFSSAIFALGTLTAN